VDASVNADSWIVDSGASCHMTPHREWFVDYEPYAVPVNVANGNQVLSAGRGTIGTLVESKWNNLRLINVLYVSSFNRNLFSTRKWSKVKWLEMRKLSNLKRMDELC